MLAGKVTAMKLMSRRSVICGSLGLTTTGLLARPHIANAAATSAIVWQVQGFVPEEDVAFRKTAEDYRDIAEDIAKGAIEIRHPERMPQLKHPRP